MLEVMYRRMHAGDRGFILSTWHYSFINAQERRGGSSKTEEESLAFLDELARNLGRSEVLVACDPLRPGKIYGWVVYRHPKLRGDMHIEFMYVKQEYRQQGIATELGKRIQAHRAPKIVVGFGTSRMEHFKRNFEIVGVTHLLPKHKESEPKWK